MDSQPEVRGLLAFPDGFRGSQTSLNYWQNSEHVVQRSLQPSSYAPRMCVKQKWLGVTESGPQRYQTELLPSETSQSNRGDEHLVTIQYRSSCVEMSPGCNGTQRRASEGTDETSKASQSRWHFREVLKQECDRARWQRGVSAFHRQGELCEATSQLLSASGPRRNYPRGEEAGGSQEASTLATQ